MAAVIPAGTPGRLPVAFLKPAFATAVAALLVTIALAAQEPSPNLYGEAAAAMLNRSFPSPRVEYLLLDLRTGKPAAMRWHGVEDAVPVGSLLKPFVALAYAEMRGGSGAIAEFPTVTCRGSADGCWRSEGHGPMTVERALAESCNAYFLQLAREITGSAMGVAAVERVSALYGLPRPPDAGSGPQGQAGMLMGLTPEWRITPLVLARAYARLVSQPATPVAARLLAGMRMAALPGGTAAKVGPHDGGVLAKTGTAPCVPAHEEACVANGDGLAVVVFPAGEPRQLLLVRERGTTGAEAAGVAGRMLSLLEASHAR